jgi:hypothetical protein
MTSTVASDKGAQAFAFKRRHEAKRLHRAQGEITMDVVTASGPPVVECLAIATKDI